MRLILALVLALLWVGPPSTATRAQSGTPENKFYVDEVERFQVKLAPDWAEVSKTDNSGRRQLYFVFRGRGDQGDLRIRKDSLKGGTLETFMKEDEISSLRFLPGFMSIKRQEPFGGGQLMGRMIEFSFKRFNKERQARYYYLTDQNGNVWTLAFTGQPNIIRSMRPDTDQLARTFKPLD